MTPPSSLHPRFAPLAQKRLEAAKKLYAADTNSLSKACALGQAYFFAGEFATNKTEQAQLAERGIAVCVRALAINPGSPQASYYHALNLGQLARTKMLAALTLVKQMRPALELAAKARPSLDYAGLTAASVCCIVTLPAGPSASETETRHENTSPGPSPSRPSIRRTSSFSWKPGSVGETTRCSPSITPLPNPSSRPPERNSSA